MPDIISEIRTLSPGLTALYNADSTVRAELDYYLEGKCTYIQALHAIACRQTAMLISIKMDLAQLAALYKVAAQESVKLAPKPLDTTPEMPYNDGDAQTSVRED